MQTGTIHRNGWVPQHLSLFLNPLEAAAGAVSLPDYSAITGRWQAVSPLPPILGPPPGFVLPALQMRPVDLN